MLQQDTDHGISMQKISRKKTDSDIAYNDITVGTSNVVFLLYLANNLI